MKRFICFTLVACLVLAVCGCEKTPNKPTTETVKQFVENSFGEVMLESNANVATNRGVLQLRQFMSWSAVAPIVNSPLDKKNIVTRKDKDGVERRMWSTIVQGTGRSDVLVHGLVANQYPVKRVSYTLYIYENGAGLPVYEKGNFEVLG